MAPLSLKIVQDDGAVTRKVKLDPKITVQEATRIVKEKANLPADAKAYALFLRSLDNDLSGIWLEEDRTLSYYMLRDGDRLDYMSKIRNLRVTMLDGAVKTLQVDQSKLVGELMISICSKIGITNHEEYGLCSVEENELDEGKENKSTGAGQTGTLTLKKKVQLNARDLQLEQLSKKLKTDDNVNWLDPHKTLSEACISPTQTLLLKRRLYYSDRNVDSRDPVQLNLLYVQARDNILNSRHPVTEDKVKQTRKTMQKVFSEKIDIKLIKLVKDNSVLYDYNDPKYMDFNAREVAWQKIGDALQKPAADCKVRWINIRDVHRRILRKSLSPTKRAKRGYKYDKHLEFMKNYYKEVVTADVEEESECEADADEGDKASETNTSTVWSDVVIDYDTEDCSNEGDSRPLKKRKTTRASKQTHDFEEVEVPVSTLDKQELNVSDPVDSFLISIGASLKRFSPYHLNLAKSKIFHIVQEHDLQQIVERQQPRSDAIITTDTPVYFQT